MWKADPAQIHSKEILGRRIFEHHLIMDGEMRRIKWEAFYDSRLLLDLSFDRLGISSTDNGVVAFLSTLGDAHGTRMSKKFEGWAQIKVSKIIGKITVKPTPQVNPEEGGAENNPYHCDVIRDDFRVRIQAESLAFMLLRFAEGEPFVERN